MRKILKANVLKNEQKPALFTQARTEETTTEQRIQIDDHKPVKYLTPSPIALSQDRTVAHQDHLKRIYLPRQSS